VSLVRLAVWCGGALLIALTAVLLRVVQPNASGAATHPALLVAGAFAAFALLTCATALRRHPLRVAAVVLASTWLLPEFAGMTALPDMVRVGADAWGWVLPALVVLVVVGTRPGGRPSSGTGGGVGAGVATRRAVALAVAGAVTAWTARVLLVDPFLDPDCWRACVANPVLVAAAPGLATVACAVATAAVLSALADAVRGAPPRSAAQGGNTVAACGSVAGLFLLAWSGASPDGPAGMTLVVAADACAVAFAGGLIVREGRERALGRGLAAVAVEVAAGPRPGALDAALGRVLGDPALRVRYWAGGRGEFVDAEGCPVTDTVEPAAAGRTTITRGGQVLAVLTHSARTGARQVDQALGPALRLALENEQLRAASLAELREVEASRARILERAEEERRRLERNLHDGAQQRVVSLALLLRMLTPRVPPRDQDLIREAARRASALLEELRRIARGIHPAAVQDAGLTGALLDLAETSTDLPITVSGDPGRALTGTAETTAFTVVIAALADARAGGAGAVRVRSAVDGSRVILDVEHDASSYSADAVDALLPYVEALAGRLAVGGACGAWSVRLELPCAS